MIGDEVLAPVVEDMSEWIIAGAVGSDPGRFRRETDGRTPAQGIQDGVDAEGGLPACVAVGALERQARERDPRGSGGAHHEDRRRDGCRRTGHTRQPWALAPLGATMHAAFGERFVLGLGRGEKDALRGMGVDVTSFAAMSRPRRPPRVQCGHRDAERRLVEEYADDVARAGIRGFARAQAWRSYRAASLSPFLPTVFVAVAFQRSDRGDAMWTQFLRGAAELVPTSMPQGVLDRS